MVEDDAPNKEPPALGAAGLLKPEKRFEGGATAGVVLDAAPCAALLGVPNPPKAGFERGVVDPLAEVVAPNRPPLAGAEEVVVGPKLNEGVVLPAVPAPAVCPAAPAPPPPKLNPVVEPPLAG